MSSLSATGQRVLKTALVASLSAAALATAAAPALAANYGPTTNGCYGIYFTRDWNQECGGGATVAGYFKSTADCTAPQIPDFSLEKYRQRGSTNSYDGNDCQYGIHNVYTYYRTA